MSATTRAPEADERLTARCMLVNLCRLDLDELREHHADLVEATTDLGCAAGLEWAPSAGDPPVVLLRALSRIALVAPEATSPRASAACARVLAGGSR